MTFTRLASSATDIEGRLAALVEQILSTHQPIPLEPGLDAEIECITNLARQECAP